MSYNTQHSHPDFSYIAVLLLLAYVMSSAPRYVRQFRDNHHNINIQSISPIMQVLKISKHYTIDPYINAWNHIVPIASVNLASVASSVLR